MALIDNKLQFLSESIKTLTEDYLKFKISGLKVPKARDVKVKQEATHNLKFKPTLSKKTKEIASKEQIKTSSQSLIERQMFSGKIVS